MPANDILKTFHYADIPKLAADGSNFHVWVLRIRSLSRVLQLESFTESKCEVSTESQKIAKNALTYAIMRMLPDEIFLTVCELDHPYDVIKTLRLRYGYAGVFAQCYLITKLASMKCTDAKKLHEYLDTLVIWRQQMKEALAAGDEPQIDSSIFALQVAYSVPEMFRPLVDEYLNEVKEAHRDDPNPGDIHHIDADVLIARLRNKACDMRFLNRARDDRRREDISAPTSTESIPVAGGSRHRSRGGRRGRGQSGRGRVIPNGV